MNPLSQNQIEEQLKKLNIAWAVVGGYSLNRVFEQSFDDGVLLVNQLAQLASTMDHHPTIQLSYDKVEVNLTTHSASGLTEKDFKFAQEIDNLNGRN